MCRLYTDTHKHTHTHTYTHKKIRKKSRDRQDLGFHSGDAVKSSLLGCYTTSLGGEWFLLFRGIAVPPSSPVTDLKINHGHSDINRQFQQFYWVH